jgi:hypothetical protein
MAWAKATPKMEKTSLRIFVEKIIFNKGQLQIFYRRVELQPDGGSSSFDKNKFQNSVVEISEKEIPKKWACKVLPQKSERGKDISSDMFFGFYSNPAHNAKATGWYIGKNGCIAPIP